MTHLLSTGRLLLPNPNTVACILSEQYGNDGHRNKANPLSELLFIVCSLQTNEALYLATYRSLRSNFYRCGF